jgi:Putative addiction module component
MSWCSEEREGFSHERSTGTGVGEFDWDTAAVETGPEIQKLWTAEAKRRYQDYVEGREVAIPGEEALRSLHAMLNGRDK